MSELLGIDANTVKIGDDNGMIIDVPLASLHFTNPIVGEKVKVYKDGDTTVVTRDQPLSTQGAMTDGEDARRINKIVYIVLTFFFGGLGVHRFMRGQVGLGILMLLVGWWATFGIWPLVDFIISLVKFTSYPGDDYIFTRNGNFTK